MYCFTEFSSNKRNGQEQSSGFCKPIRADLIKLAYFLLKTNKEGP